MNMFVYYVLCSQNFIHMRRPFTFPTQPGLTTPLHSGTPVTSVLYPLTSRPIVCVYISVYACRQCGLELDSYRHYDPSTCGFNAASCSEDLKVACQMCTQICPNLCMMFFFFFFFFKFKLQRIPDRSMVLFHACAHNPTGADMTVGPTSSIYIAHHLFKLAISP